MAARTTGSGGGGGGRDPAVIGATIGKWTLTSYLGSGAFGKVFKATTVAGTGAPAPGRAHPARAVSPHRCTRTASSLIPHVQGLRPLPPRALPATQPAFVGLAVATAAQLAWPQSSSVSAPQHIAHLRTPVTPPPLSLSLSTPLGPLHTPVHPTHPHLPQVAVKSVDAAKLDAAKRDDLMMEIRVMKRLARHPHIVDLIDFACKGSTVFIAMEYCDGGDLAQLLQQKGCLAEPMASHFLNQLADALAYLDRAGIAHLDLKPANILLSTLPPPRPPVLRLADFGLSSLADRDGKAGAGSGKQGKLRGSPLYMAPEIVLHRRCGNFDIIFANIISPSVLPQLSAPCHPAHAVPGVLG